MSVVESFGGAFFKTFSPTSPRASYLSVVIIPSATSSSFFSKSSLKVFIFSFWLVDKEIFSNISSSFSKAFIDKYLSNLESTESEISLEIFSKTSSSSPEYINGLGKDNLFCDFTIFSIKSFVPFFLLATISTTGQPRISERLSLSITSPFDLTISIIFKAIIVGIPSSISWLVR